MNTNMTDSAELTAMLMTLTHEVRALRTEVGELRRAKAKGSELMDEIGPIGLEIMAAATETFGDLEAKGYFNFGRELVGVVDHIVAAYTADDVKELGDSVVAILDTVRALTQPDMLAFAQHAVEGIEEGEEADPVTVWETMKASKDADVQHGMAVMLSLVRQIGRTARDQTPRKRDEPKHPKYANMAGRLASTRSRKSGRRLALPPAVSVNMPKPSPSAVDVEALNRDALAAPFNALATDPNGHLLDANDWSLDYAQAVATQAGVGQLTEDHIVVLNFARASFFEKGKSPNVRALATGAGVGTKGIYTLFPKKPGPTIARIAGIPKPVGCI